jgi:iron complex outermembrane receptor protein
VPLAACVAPVTVQATETSGTDFLGLSLEELAEVEVAVVSLLPTKATQAGSTVDVIQEQDWQKRGARRMLDAVTGLPATMVLPMHLGADALVIRGYGGISSYSGTALQWDGVPLNDLFAGSGFINLPNLNLGTLDRMELIRGPGSALYGSDAYHGVLALHAFDSSQDMQRVGSEIGSDGYYEVNGRFSTKAFSHSRLNVSVAGSGQPDQQRDYEFTDPTTLENREGERANEYATQTLALKLDSSSDDQWGYSAGLYAHHYDADRSSGLGTILSGNQDVSSNDTDFVMSRLNLSRYLDAGRSVEMQSYAWHAESDAETRLQQPGGFIDRLIPREQQRGGLRAIFRDADSISYTRWAFMAGADRLEVTDADLVNRYVDGSMSQRFVHPASDARRTIRYATLEADTHSMDEVWRVIYGGRFDDYSDVGSHFSPRFGIIAQPEKNTAIKFLYGNAFHAPTALELYGSTGAAEGNAELDPEILDSYELVLMKRSDHWRAQLELFRSRWRDAIVSTATDDNVVAFTFGNLERNTAHGVSISTEWEYLPWTVRFNGAYTESENTSTNKIFGLFPSTTMNFGIGYDFYQLATQIFVNHIHYSHFDDVLAVEAGFAAKELPSYSRTDVTATHRASKELETFAVVRNLFDRDNRLPSAMGSRGGIPDERASLSVGFRYSF